MKSHPLIFQAWGIRAIRNVVPSSWPAVAIDPSQPIKTMTRRVMKPQPKKYGEVHLLPLKIDAPYTVGDQIWTRESCYQSPLTGEIKYKADEGFIKGWKPIPSIHMHRVDSRDDLLIHNIRAERVQDISDKDAIAEGVGSEFRTDYTWIKGRARNKFRSIWNVINADPKLYSSDIMRLGVEPPYYVSFPWDESNRDPREEINGLRHYCFPNPYVWVYEIGKLQ